MKEYELNNFIRERIEENKELFTSKELTKISNNFTLTKKIYLLAFSNCKDTYL